jgi:hypothetical protein
MLVHEEGISFKDGSDCAYGEGVEKIGRYSVETEGRLPTPVCSGLGLRPSLRRFYKVRDTSERVSLIKAGKERIPRQRL